MAEKNRTCVYDTWPEFQHEDSKQEKANGPAQEYCEQEVADTHFRHCRAESENFERHRRRKHGRKHEAPERMLLESGMQLFEALGGDALAQQFLASGVADGINNQAAYGRAGRCHENVKQKSSMVLGHISGHDNVHRKAEGSTVERGYGKDSPHTERLQNRPEKGGIAGENMFESIQWIAKGGAESRTI